MPDKLPAQPALFGFVGRSGAGKTTLITDVIDCLRLDGFTVSAIKRAHDGFDLDRPGKDSWRLREAGCREVMMVGDRRWALLHEYDTEPEPTPLALAQRMATRGHRAVRGLSQRADSHDRGLPAFARPSHAVAELPFGRRRGFRRRRFVPAAGAGPRSAAGGRHVRHRAPRARRQDQRSSAVPVRRATAARDVRRRPASCVDRRQPNPRNDRIRGAGAMDRRRIWAIISIFVEMLRHGQGCRRPRRNWRRQP